MTSSRVLMWRRSTKRLNQPSSPRLDGSNTSTISIVILPMRIGRAAAGTGPASAGAASPAGAGEPPSPPSAAAEQAANSRAARTTASGCEGHPPDELGVGKFERVPKDRGTTGGSRSVMKDATV